MNAVETLRTLLAKNIVRFTYQKVDGEIRHAVGTRNLDIARAKTGVDIPAPRFGEQPYSYYDVEKMGWRSYKPELLISIDGVTPVEYVDLRKPVKEIPVLGGKPFSELSENDKGVVADIETDIAPRSEENPMTGVLKGLFGGVGFSGGAEMPIFKKGELPKREVKVGTPVATESGIALPVGAVSAEDFAKMVAHYVVEELVERITR